MKTIFTTLTLFVSIFIITNNSNAQVNCSATACYYYMQPGVQTLDCSKTNTFYDPQQTTVTPPAVNGTGINWVPPSASSTSNYLNNVDMTETFQTSNGQCLTVNFNLVGPSLFGIGAGDTLWLYDGPSIASTLIAKWDCAGCASASGNSTQPTTTYTSTTVGGLTFRFKSNGADNGKGWACRFGCITCPSAPSNDPCSGAQYLLPGASCTYTSGLINAPTNPTTTAPSCGGSIPNTNDDVWYYFVASQTTATITVPGGSNMAPVVQLLTGGCSSLTQVGSCSYTTTVGATVVMNATGLTIGQTYYVRIFDYYGGGGSAVYNFNICITQAAPVDCAGATLVCNTSSFSHTQTQNPDYGTQEYVSSYWGCDVSGEIRSAWYYFQISTSGTWGFTVTGANSAVYTDVDFVVWGPMASKSCPMNTSPLRCSYAIAYSSNSYGLPPYSTGLESAEADLTEGAGGNAFVQTINATAGQWYVIMVNIYTGNATYNITWNDNIPAANQAGFWSCVTPIELLSFNGENVGSVNVLNWATASETNNDFFAIERSTDGTHFTEVGDVKGAGTSTEELRYNFNDQFPIHGVNYYRLRQTDFDGTYTYSRVIAIENSSTTPVAPYVYPNPSEGVFNVGMMAESKGNVEIEVLNNIGQLIDAHQEHVEVGQNNFSLDLSAFDQGVYTLVIREDHYGNVYTKKIVKL